MLYAQEPFSSCNSRVRVNLRFVEHNTIREVLSILYYMHSECMYTVCTYERFDIRVSGTNT